MPLPAYPAINGSALVDSWQVDNPYLDPLETDMEGGNKRIRTRPGDEMAQISFAVLMTLAEYETFKTFVATTLGRGASRFTMNIWNGSSVVNKTVQLVKGKYSNKAQPPKMIVQLSLYVYGGL